MNKLSELYTAHTEYVVEDICLGLHSCIPVFYGIIQIWSNAPVGVVVTDAVFGLVSLFFYKWLTSPRISMDWLGIRSESVNEDLIDQSIALYKKQTARRIAGRYLVQTPVTAAVCFSTFVWWFR